MSTMKITSLLVAAAIQFAPHHAQSASGAAYESMLKHSIGRWEYGLGILQKEGSTASVAYLCKNADNASALANEFSGKVVSLTEEKVLGYTAKLVVNLPVPPNTATHEQWLRRQFFIGIAYLCDMDGIDRAGK